MWRMLGTVMAFLLSVSIAASAIAAAPASEGERAPGARPIWGMVTQASAESITIAPEVAVRRNRRNADKQAAADKPVEKPPERAFALVKDQTEYAFAEVGMKRLMANGSTLRTLTEPEPASAADVKVGQLVEVTPDSDDAGAAKRIIIAWSAAGQIVKVEGDTLTFRRSGEADGAAPKPDENGAAAPVAAAAAAEEQEQELTISKSATRVRIASITDERPAPNGRGMIRSISYKDGTLADLKADQSVIICIKNDAAMKITILAGNGKS